MSEGKLEPSLLAVAADLDTVAERLRGLIDDNRFDVSPDGGPAEGAAPSTLTLAGLASTALSCRRTFEKFVGEDLFSDPARDILLDLFVAATEGRRIHVTSACMASNVPYTTALRYITALKSVGLVASELDTRDGRRTYLALTPLGFEKLKTALTAMLETTQRAMRALRAHG